MKSKLSWAFFIPLTLAAVFFKLAQVVMPDGSVFGLSDMQLDYVMLGCVVLIFLAALILCLADKKISPYYLLRRNFPAGILGLLTALLFAADGANRLYHIVSSGEVQVLDVAEALLLALSAVVFVVLGLTHLLRNRESKMFALFNVMPALLCAIRMIQCFVGFTTISITLADVTLLGCYIFATLFFFNYAVALSLTEARNAVKSCLIFGLPAAAAIIAYCAAAYLSAFNTDDLLMNFGLFELTLLGLYILSFVIELSIFVKTRDEVKIAGVDDEEYDELEQEENMNAFGFVVTGMSEEDRMEPTAEELEKIGEEEGFIYEEQNEDEEDRDTVNDLSGYITDVVEAPEVSDDPKEFDDRLDEIDKLIIQISEDLY